MSEPAVKRRMLPYDRKKIGNAECDKVFRECLQFCPITPYAVDTHSHAWCIEQCLQNAAVLAYPRDACTKHQSYITDYTFQKICNASTSKRTARRVYVRIKYSSCAWCFRVWFSRKCIRPWHSIFQFAHRRDLRACIKLARTNFSEREEIRGLLKLEKMAYVMEN